jgi:lysylphosphatidylglycerol synthetase-like protein (DUF2156 family)
MINSQTFSFLNKLKALITRLYINNKFKLYWVLITLYVGYFLYDLNMIGQVISQEMYRESSWLNYLLLDGLRVFGFVLAVKGILLYGLLKTNKAAYFLTMALIALSCNHFIFVDYNLGTLSFNIIMEAVFLINWQNFNLYHPKFNLERKMLFILSMFVGLLFFQKWGFRLLKSEFTTHFGFIDLVTSYTNTLINPSILFSYEQIEPNSLIGWIFFYLILYFGAAFLITVVCLLVVPNLNLLRSKTDWKASLDTEQLKLDQDPLAVFKQGQNLDVFYDQNMTLYYKFTDKICFVLGDPVFDNSELYQSQDNTKIAITNFVKYINLQGKVICFYQVSDRYLEYFNSIGLIPIHYAQEAFLESKLDLSKPTFKSLRNSCSRLSKDKIALKIQKFSELTAQNYSEFESLHQIWQDHSNYQNMGFTSGYNLFQKDLSGYLVTMYNATQNPVALFSFLPFDCSTGKALTLDYILRNPKTNSSIIEAGLVSCINYFFDHKYQVISLGLASHPSLQNPILIKIAGLLNIKFNSSGLRGFKQKFQPTWYPRYIVTENYQFLPQIYTDLQTLLFPNN